MKSRLNNITIISGGQSGTDRAALDFALAHRIPCSGWCPKGRLAEDGRIDEKYPLTETASADPDERTKMNIADSHGTLVIYRSEIDEGTRFTLQYAKTQMQAVYIVKHGENLNKEEFRLWLDINKIKALNVAGPRESRDKGVYAFAGEVLENLFS
jgi:predicted Rossmann fold nucleotide-binding protein DprA/Smf involved in DNA uptake